jgi:hypothetical protein
VLEAGDGGDRKEQFKKMRARKTDRGFDYIEFYDRYDRLCSIQKSSLAGEDCIWLGINDADPKILASKVKNGLTGWVKYPIPEDVSLTTRMHLTTKQVEELIIILNLFVKTGEITKE